MIFVWSLKKSKLIRLMQAMTNPGAICQSIDKTEFDDSEMFNLICNYNKINRISTKIHSSSGFSQKNH